MTEMSRHAAAQIRPYVAREPDPPRSVSYHTIVLAIFKWPTARNGLFVAGVVVPLSLYALLTSPHLSTKVASAFGLVGFLVLTGLAALYTRRVARAVRVGVLAKGRLVESTANDEVTMTVYHSRETFTAIVPCEDVPARLASQDSVDLLVDPTAPKILIILGPSLTD